MSYVRQLPCKVCDAMLTLEFRRKPSVSRLLKEAERAGGRVCEYEYMVDGVVFFCGDECAEVYQKALDAEAAEGQPSPQETTT